MPSNDHPPVKAALFDFGGTLFSYASTVPARRRRASELGKLIGHADVDQVFDALNNNIAASFRRALSQSFYMHADVFAAGVEGAASDLGYPLSSADARAFAERTALHTLQDIEPRPGMRDTLEKLREGGIHLGGVSNADVVQFDLMVKKLGVADVFHSLLCSEEARSCKPDSAIFFQALDRAGCRPEETLFIGDTPNMDIVGAEAVGMRGILIEETTDIAIDRGSADGIQTTIRELPELLDLI